MIESPNTAFLKGFKGTFENSLSLYDSAISLEKSKKYGIACSLLILSAEECVKSYFLFCRYFLPESEIIDFKRIFENHKFKIDTIQKILVFQRIFIAFDELFYKPQIDNILDKKHDIASLRKKSFENLLYWLNKEASSKKSEIDIMVKWWKHSKTLKEEGFYVSFNQERFGYPNQIKQKVYIETKKQVDILISAIKNIYRIDFNNSEIQEILLEMKVILLKSIYK